jgi:hypothetical protein
MQNQRLTEANILGYRIDRIEQAARATSHYEVLGPDNDAVLASFLDRPSAEQFIVMRELRSIELRPRNPVY